MPTTYLTVVHVTGEGIMAQETYVDELNRAKTAAHRAQVRLMNTGKDYHIVVMNSNTSEVELQLVTPNGRMHPFPAHYDRTPARLERGTAVSRP